jgi:hypothetical protein
VDQLIECVVTQSAVTRVLDVRAHHRAVDVSGQLAEQIGVVLDELEEGRADRRNRHDVGQHQGGIVDAFHEVRTQRNRSPEVVCHDMGQV